MKNTILWLSRATRWAALTLIALPIFFASCTEEDKPNNTPKFGNLTIEIDHVWGMDQKPFLMNTPMVHPMSGDTMTFSLIKYYLSNFELIKADGSSFKVPNSYFLVSETDNKIELTNIPMGDYTAVNFLVGVDSAANNSGLQQGALNPSNGMFWSWSTGYIFVRVEGTSPQAANNTFLFHLGGYMPPYSAIQKKNMLLGGNSISVKPDAAPVLHIRTNVAKLWHGPVKLADVSVVHSISNLSVSMSANFRDGITFDHIHQ